MKAGLEMSVQTKNAHLGPVLFLDYDGVLHPDEVFLERGKPVLRARGELFMWTPLLEAALVG